MIFFIKHTKCITYFLTTLMLFQSCVIYKSKPSTIEDATTKENQFIKITTKAGEKYKVRWVEQRGDNIYTITNTKRVNIKKDKVGALKLKYELFNIESRGDYISGLKMTSKDTASLIIPIEQIDAIKLPNKGLSTLVPIGSTVLVMGALFIGMLLLLDGESVSSPPD